jgi:hypothetical protein
MELMMMTTPILVTGIEDDRYKSAEYLILDLYFPTMFNGKTALIYIFSKAHVVDNLRANVLVGVDLLVPMGFNIDLHAKIATIKTCYNI